MERVTTRTANNDLILNEYGLNMKMSNQYKGIVFRWFYYLHRINNSFIAK